MPHADVRDPASRLERFFAPGGTLCSAPGGREWRRSQVDMAHEVLATLQDGGHLVVEAGTGIGKTLAYLVPAVLLGRRVIISTGTKTLQDQLALKDVPFLQEECGLKFSACVVKGRDNYLCRQRLETFTPPRGALSPAEALAWAQVRPWAEQTLVGDVAELADIPENPSFWSEINARNATCLGSRCPRHAECHLQEVRRAARAADVIIVNHHLFLADAALRSSQFGEVLPEADVAIFDEAHRLESAATSFFGHAVSNWRMRELADDALRELLRARVDVAHVGHIATRLADEASTFARCWGAEGRHVMPARLAPAQDESLRGVLAAVRQLEAALSALPHRPPEAEPLLRRAAELSADVERFVTRDDTGWVHWTEVRGRGAFLTATPVDVAPLLWERVFARLQSSVLCSATLAVDGSMAHVRRRLGLATPSPEHLPPADGQSSAPTPPAVRERILPSPFDYEEQGLLYVPPRMPDPRHPTFAGACAQQAAALIAASSGRAFLLFTSFENLRKVHEILLHELAFPILVQGEAPKHELLRRFRATSGSVLFATSSFWEGVDVQGEALSLVVIDKLPFAVPSDPIVAARSRLVEEAGGNAFRDYSLPEAVLALKQGVGRLIRSRSDRGVVAILDPRVRGSAYGSRFLGDLPPFRRTQRLDDVRVFFGASPADTEERELA